MKYDILIFWQNILSPHQLPFLEKLVELKPNQEILLIVEKSTNSHRIELGWRFNKNINIDIIENPNMKKIFQLLNRKNSIHFFSGIFAYKLIRKAFLLSIYKKSIISIISEAPDLRGIKGSIRKFASIFIERPLKNRISSVYEIGKECNNWYKWCGYDERKIFNFGYCVKNSSANVVANNFPQHRFIFVGRLIKLKNLSYLIHVLSLIPKKSWSLTIVGCGEELSNLQNQTNELKLNSNIVYRGVIDNENISSELAMHDTLLLPSNYDGWGAVINEAINAGVYVICSNRCGAAEIIANNKIGLIFDIEDETSLLNMLNLRIKKGKRTEIEANYIMEYSKKITPLSFATYFYSTIDNIDSNQDKILPPWLSE